MKFTFVLPMILFVSSFSAFSNPYSHSDALLFVDSKIGEFEMKVPLPANPSDVDWVKKKLQAMRNCDQFLRSEWENIATQFELSGEEKAHFNRGMGIRMNSQDAWNTAHLKAILDHHEWIKVSMFGKEAESHAWLIVQHADLDWDFQSKMLPVLEKMLLQNESNPKNFAYLYDRVARAYNRPAKTKPQRFGTQGFCNHRGEWEPFEMEDLSRVDIWRAQYGLGPLAEYKKLFNCKM